MDTEALTARAVELAEQLDAIEGELTRENLIAYSDAADLAHEEIYGFTRDPEVLKAAAGPPLEVGERASWRDLLWYAASRLEHEAMWAAKTTEELADYWADRAIVEAAGIIPSDWKRATVEDLERAVGQVERLVPEVRARVWEYGGWRVDAEDARRLLRVKAGELARVAS